MRLPVVLQLIVSLILILSLRVTAGEERAEGREGFDEEQMDWGTADQAAVPLVWSRYLTTGRQAGREKAEEEDAAGKRPSEGCVYASGERGSGSCSCFHAALH